jgi:hypothetical protein
MIAAMLVREKRTRPEPWPEYRRKVRRPWSLPLHRVEHALQWAAYGLSRWAFLECLEYLGILSILVAVFFYFSEAGDRRKQKHYQAWQVINTAQGKGGSGGRIEALQELNSDGEALVGVDLSGAFLQGLRLPGARLMRADLSAADLRDALLDGADLRYAALRSSNLRHGRLRGADLTGAVLEGADLVAADLSGLQLPGARLDQADLRGAELRGLGWRELQSIAGANLYGVRDAPDGFLTWALAHGAVAVKGEDPPPLSSVPVNGPRGGTGPGSGPPGP